MGGRRENVKKLSVGGAQRNQRSNREGGNSHWQGVARVGKTSRLTAVRPELARGASAGGTTRKNLPISNSCDLPRRVEDAVGRRRGGIWFSHWGVGRKNHSGRI